MKIFNLLLMNSAFCTYQAKEEKQNLLEVTCVVASWQWGLKVVLLFENVDSPLLTKPQFCTPVWYPLRYDLDSVMQQNLYQIISTCFILLFFLFFAIVGSIFFMAYKSGCFNIFFLFFSLWRVTKRKSPTFSLRLILSEWIDSQRKLFSLLVVLKRGPS